MKAFIAPNAGSKYVQVVGVVATLHAKIAAAPKLNETLNLIRRPDARQTPP